MKLILTMDMNNNAFKQGRREAVRLLRQSADRLERDGITCTGEHHKIMDVNGNTVGRVFIK